MTNCAQCFRSASGTLRSSILVLALGWMLAVGVAHPVRGQTYQVLYTFTGGTDGASPDAGLTMDPHGNLYGTAEFGGYYGGNCSSLGCGTAFELARSGSSWVMKPLHSFATETTDGAFPAAPLVFGPDGALYGTTVHGGSSGCLAGCGTVFKLTPPATICQSIPCPWDETVLTAFPGGASGLIPYSGVVFDASGNIYGTTSQGGVQSLCNAQGCGVVYELSHINDTWTESVVYSFTGSNGADPQAGLTFNASGNLYGTTLLGGAYNQGTVFTLVPSGSGWTGSTILNFTGGRDGGGPSGGVIFDQQGNLYGVSEMGGQYYFGTAFELTPSSGGWDETVLENFGGNTSTPIGPLVMGLNGSLYGVSEGEMNSSVFKLTPGSGGWTYTDLHDFSSGAFPNGGLVLDSNGNLYGTTFGGGNDQCHPDAGCGFIYEITP